MYRMNIKYVATHSHRIPAPTSHFFLPWTKRPGLYDLKINSEIENILGGGRILWTANFLNTVSL